MIKKKPIAPIINCKLTFYIVYCCVDPYLKMPTKNEIKELLDLEKEKSDQLESEVLSLHRRLKEAEHDLS